MEWDSDHREVPTQDKRFIRADATARWRIVDPLQYFVRVTTERAAQSRLDDIVGGAMKNVITSLNLIESVRSSNREFTVLEEDSFGRDKDSRAYTIKKGRHKIGEMIMEQANPNLIEYGIQLEDVRLRRINYKDTVRREVYQRMIAERERMAEYYRSEGQGRKMKIEGKREKDLKTIESGAYRTAEEIRGQADAEATRIYAEVYGEDPEFYAFLKTLESYEKTVDSGVELILTTNSDFYKYLKSMGDPED
jgi:membrane protease subunit HflC